jgi:hypothetical protein
LVPVHLLWVEVFRALSGEPEAAASGIVASLPASDRAVARQRANIALQRAHQVKLESIGDTQAGDVEEAEVLLEARDDLIRRLDPGSVEILERAASAAVSGITVVSRPIGRILPGAGGRECQVILRGKDYPHMIPEADYWRLYFVSLASAAAPFRHSDGSYAEEHLKAVHSSLRIPYDEISRVLELSYQVATDLQALTSSPAAQSIADKIVTDARTQLLRSMSEILWLQVKQDADRARYGMRVSYVTKQ